ncbi:ribosomal RNA small subunit methyltransferase H [Microlunatus endophyticus]|uniref:Ribosomal RNA small subunit methyltransferase H n=1 Tax=Microlunatus endophyticus TaxID=1716077 RepID=A0A917SGM0_9ACTN|nr:16S rRNA (cytosine(1402)-N(4))-methyltransferase RsmH [Microlunatus endophyticus]GGL75997.1 ribosomal RNA small subunit methyltransferase H [Microlunatus endophyticus]
MAEQHVPVMLTEITELLMPALTLPGSAPILVDCTLGLGGHAAALLEVCPQARLIGLDRDTDALAIAGQRLAAYADRIDLVHAVYDELPDVLAERGIAKVQAILLDLGLSSLQIDRTERGFAYATDAPLDMRMDQTEALTAAEVVNSYPVRDLSRILRIYGEERFADRIAGAIGREREREPITDSARLVRIIASAVPMAAQRTGGHPAKRTFQALRIEVNHELEALEGVLPEAVAALEIGGRIAVLAYHSLEDRLVKQVLRLASTDRAPRGLPVVPPELGPELRLLTRGAHRPTEAESATNPRARSARLRAAERIAEARQAA